MTDVQGNIQFVNPAFEQTAGYSREEGVSQNTRILKSAEQDDFFIAICGIPYQAAERGLAVSSTSWLSNRASLINSAWKHNFSRPKARSGGPAGRRSSPRFQQYAQRNPRL